MSLHSFLSELREEDPATLALTSVGFLLLTGVFPLLASLFGLGIFILVDPTPPSISCWAASFPTLFLFLSPSCLHDSFVVFVSFDDCHLLLDPPSVPSFLPRVVLFTNDLNPPPFAFIIRNHTCYSTLFSFSSSPIESSMPMVFGFFWGFFLGFVFFFFWGCVLVFGCWVGLGLGFHPRFFCASFLFPSLPPPHSPCGGYHDSLDLPPPSDQEAIP